MRLMINCCKKLWNYIGHSVMKWYTTIVFNYNVWHLFVLHSKHRSGTFTCYSSCIIQSKMGFSHPNSFWSRMWLYEGLKYSISKGVLHISHLYVRWLHLLIRSTIKDHLKRFGCHYLHTSPIMVGSFLIAKHDNHLYNLGHVINSLD